MSQADSNTDPAAAAAAADGVRLWALLIGIDDYEAVGKLQGCVNDVEAVRELLRGGMDVPDDHIRVLTDAAATRAGILAAIEEFLIGNPAILFGDQILLHYSGHGSRMPSEDPAELDGLDETIVPRDGRTPGVFDISDKTLAAMLARLAAEKGDQITLVFDSCHSGGVVRGDAEAGETLQRWVPDDERRPPAGLDAEWRQEVSRRGAGVSDFAAAAFPYVLLAGCREKEVSNEYAARDGDTKVMHGALTYALLRALRQPGGCGQRTYGELHETVAAWVNGYYPMQMPQCEGDRGRLVFGGTHVESDPFLEVIAVKGRQVTLNGGLAHGLRQGTRLALYPPTVRTRRDLPPRPLACVEVTTVAATTSLAKILDEAASGPTSAVPLNARALVSRQADADLQQTIALHPPAEASCLMDEMRRRLASATAQDALATRFLRLSAAEDGAADLHVWLHDDGFHLCGSDRDLLATVPGGPGVGEAGGVDAALRALASIARFRWLHQLANTDTASRLAGKIKLGLRRLNAPAAGSEPPAVPEGGAPAGDAGPPTLLFDPVDRGRNLYSVEVRNESPLSIYAQVFAMSQDFSITRIYPRLGQQDQLDAGRTLPCGLGDRRELLEIYLPDDPRWQQSRDSVLVIATTVPSDLALLEQKPLEVPPLPPTTRGSSALANLLAFRLASPASRLGRANQEDAAEDWATAELRFEVVRATTP
jgi:hypothetical protein